MTNIAPNQHIATTITPATTKSPSMGILTNKYMAIKINRPDNTANDESIMAIIQAIFKSILKAAPEAQIIAPETNKLLEPITRKQGNIPDSIETRVIRRYVHKGSLTKDYFHGLIHLSTPQPMDILGNDQKRGFNKTPHHLIFIPCELWDITGGHGGSVVWYNGSGKSS